MKLKLFILSLSLVAVSFTAKAQEFMTRTGHITFLSQTPMETIEANNFTVASKLDTKTGELIFSLINKSFQFKQALMEEHYNEKYMESDKYPKITFKGKIKDLSKVNFSKDGVYQVIVDGDLSLHGVTKTISEPGTIEVKGSEINAKSNFSVVPEDYKIEIPGLVREKIARTIPITVDMNYKPKK